MRKTIAVLLVIAVCAVFFIPLTTAYAMPIFEEGMIKGDKVNMRMRPTTDSPSIMVLEKGDRIGVFCEEVEGWYRIIYGNYRGYINADYVFLPSAGYLVGHVQQSVSVRETPGIYSNIITTIDEGTGLTILDIVGDWYLIEIPLDLLDGEEADDQQPAQNDQPAQDGQTDSQEPDDIENAGIDDNDNSDDMFDDVPTGYVHSDYITLSTGKNANMKLEFGMKGANVRNMQLNLRKRGFLEASATGYYGELTVQAVKDFQKMAKLTVDGVAGPKTLEVLYSDAKISVTRAQKSGIKGSVKMTAWSSVQNVFKRGSKALVTDVRSGRQFYVRRYGGTLHADVEPLTADDTANMKKAYGGSWSWSRRAVWVTIGNTTYAASMNGMPHANGSISGNNFNGHFCIHFKDSMTHENRRKCPQHQACVKYAYERGNR